MDRCTWHWLPQTACSLCNTTKPWSVPTLLRFHALSEQSRLGVSKGLSDTTACLWTRAKASWCSWAVNNNEGPRSTGNTSAAWCADERAEGHLCRCLHDKQDAQSGVPHLHCTCREGKGHLQFLVPISTQGLQGWWQKAECFGLLIELNAYTVQDYKPDLQEQPRAPKRSAEPLGLTGLTETSGPKSRCPQNTLAQGNPGYAVLASLDSNVAAELEK